MSYVGLNPQVPLLNTSTQTFSGNAAALQFTLARSVASASDLDVLIGNVPQRPFTDYTAGNTVLLFASAPASGSNNITVTYRAGALNSLDLTATVFNAGTVGAPSVVSLAANNTGLYWANASSMTVTVSGVDRATFNSSANSTSNTSGALVVSGGIGATGNINTSGVLRVTNTTESSSVSTGAVIVSGGAGVVGNLNVGGDITCVGDFTVNGTFTTTGTDSLEVNDPFIFLANANPGDTYDTGVVSEYYDGSITRYTGYFRDITDNKYKLFGNLSVKPTTTVDTANASFQYQDLILANLSATGNVSGTYIIGDGSLLTGISSDTTKIFNGNSTVNIGTPNGSIVANVNANTVATISSTGVAVTGLVSATTTISAAGNITGANINTGNIVSAAGNVIGGNVVTGGLISATANVTGGNILTAGLISATGQITGSQFNGSGAGLTSIPGSNVSGTVASATTAGTVTTAAQPNITSVGTLTSVSTTGNVSAANVVIGSTIPVAVGALVITATQGSPMHIKNAVGTSYTEIGFYSNANIHMSGVGVANPAASVYANTSYFWAANGLVLSGNGASDTNRNIFINNSGIVTIPGTVAATTTSSGALTVSGGVGVGGNMFVGGLISTTGNITGGNILGGANVNAITHTGTTASLSGNVTGGNINTGGLVSAAGAVTAGGNVAAANISTAGLITAIGNITGGNINTAGVYANSLISATGNVTGGNIITNGAISAGGLISATGNVTGGNINTAGLVSATGNITNGTANILTGNAIVTTLVQGATVSATGNVVGGNLNASGLSLSGNVMSALNSVSAFNTTGNITGGNVNGGANVFATTHTGTTVSVTANVTGGNVLTGGLISATGNITGGNLITTGALGTTGNLTANNLSVTNLSTATILSATGNVVGGNILTGGLISATGQITGNSLTVTANTTSGNLLTGGLISATGNITGGNILGGANVNATTHTGTTASLSGNVTGGNLATGGNLTLSGASARIIGDFSNATFGSRTMFQTSTANGVTNVVALPNGTSAVAAFTTVNNSSDPANAGFMQIATISSSESRITSGTTGTGTYANLTVFTGGSERMKIDTNGNITASGPLSVTGNVIGGNVTTAGLISATGNITGGNILGGANVNATTHTGTTASLSGNVTGGNIGTAGRVSATGNVIGGNVTTAGLISATGNITGGNLATGGNLNFSSTSARITGDFSNATIASRTLFQTSTANAVTGVVALPNGTSVVSVFAAFNNSDPTNAGFIQIATISSSESRITSGITGTGTYANLTTHVGGSERMKIDTNGNITASGPLSVTGNVTGGNILTAGLVSATGAITGAAITGTSLTVSTGNVTLGNIVNAGANGVGNIGSATTYFNTVFAKATSAQYADLAEMYCADQDYPPGTVLAFGGDQEVTMSQVPGDARVAGVVSTNPAHLMNSTLQCTHPAAVALTGRVPTLVVGVVRKGDMMVAAGNGHAQACATPAMGTVIGKAVENFDGAQGIIEIVVGRL